jgi:late competence protein required for DNA uptake (superfamily II DNA/RNA helicase)
MAQGIRRRESMVPCRSIEIDNDREKVIQDILNWGDSKDRVLNLVTVPYNSSIIFLDIILKYVLNKQRVLYITNEDNENIDIINCIKKHTNFRDYTYVKNNVGSNRIRTFLYIVSPENALSVSQSFDLVIYDDITSLSSYTKYEILDLLASFSRDGAKLICRSIESVFQNAKCIDIPVKDCRLPLAEPRIITTRIDVNKEIPYVVYEYLSWSINSERKVIIYVPDEERGENVYKYLLTFRENLHNNIIYFKDKSELKSLTNFIKNKRGIIIMNYFKDIAMELKDTDVMVYFADDKVFDYKKLLYLCGKVGRSASLGNGEVIFLAKESTKEMEFAKDITRGFNKQAWEFGLLNV